MRLAQIIAIVIFVGMFLMILLDKVERFVVTLVSGVLILVVVFGVCMHSGTAILETLNLGSLLTIDFWYGGSTSTTGVNWSTIIFIAGMMVMVEGLGRAGFFQWLCLLLAKLVHYHTAYLLLCFMAMAAVLAMFIDSITVVLFLATATAELSRVLEFNPVPMILSEIFCANLGGAATMCGDPPNIIIGTSLGLTFEDFITNTGEIVLFCFILTAVYFWLCFHKELERSEHARTKHVAYPQPKQAITNRWAFAVGTLIFAVAVVLLVTHAHTKLTVACIGVIVGTLTMFGTYLTSGADNVKYILRHVDYKTLLFFVGLFISVAGLEQTGVLTSIAQLISELSGGNVWAVIAIILWVSAVASSFVDNIPFAATMVPIIQSIAATQGISLASLAWTLSLGTDIGGNATPIGASANVVGTSVAAKEGHLISWREYCKYCVPATIMVITVSMIWLFLKYG